MGRPKRRSVGADGAAGDAVAGSAAGGAQGASRAVLGGDRSWGVERGGGGGGGRVGGRWRPVVQGGWRDAAVCRSVAPLSGRYLSFAEREEIASAARPELWGAGDRAAARSLAVDDLPRAAS